MNIDDIIKQIKSDLSKGDVIVKSDDGFRYYTDALTESIIVPLTDKETTAKLYKEKFIDAAIKKQAITFDTLPRVSMFVGQPDTGKTFKAFKIAEALGIEPIFIMCRDNLNLETLLEDFLLEDGKPTYKESLAIKALTDVNKKEAIIIMDEFNTLPTGVMKTLQPLFDNTSKTFVYRSKVYQKNLNCKFIVTLNDKDRGISVLPNAIISRSRIEYFEPVSINKLSEWTGVDIEWIKTLKDVYKTLKLLDIFGTRQIKTVKQMTTEDQLISHLHGLCATRNEDPKLLNTLAMKQLLAKLQ